MNQIKNSFSSIEQMTSKLCQPTGKTSGSSQAKGSFQEMPHKANILQFEIDTDQSCFLSVIQDIENLRAKWPIRAKN